MSTTFNVETYRNNYRRERGIASWGDAGWQQWEVIDEAVRLARDHDSHGRLFDQILDLLHADECTDVHTDAEDLRTCRAHWNAEANAMTRAVRSAFENRETNA